MPARRVRILVPLAPGYEETETVATADVLSRAGVQPVLASLPGEARLVRGSHGFALEASYPLDEVVLGDFAGVFLPGGMPGTKHLRDSRGVRDAVIEFARRGKLLAAICAAPTVLHAAGLLRGRRMTCHPSSRPVFVDCNYEELPVVVDRPFITSRGPGTALLCGLTMVACLKGCKAATDLAEAMVVDLPAGLAKEWGLWGLTS